MIAAMLLLISLVALTQFALYYWRAMVAAVAALPLSDRVCTAAGLANASVGSADFDTLLKLHQLTPELKEGNGGLRLVRAYYRAMKTLGSLVELHLPALAAWVEREKATCSHYVAVLVDQRLERNLTCAAEIRCS